MGCAWAYFYSQHLRTGLHSFLGWAWILPFFWRPSHYSSQGWLRPYFFPEESGFSFLYWAGIGFILCLHGPNISALVLTQPVWKLLSEYGLVHSQISNFLFTFLMHLKIVYKKQTVNWIWCVKIFKTHALSH